MIKSTEKNENNLKQLSKEQSIEAILAAATKVLSQEGYAGATISRVAETAGVSRGLLHYHFKNKEELLAKVLRENMKKSVEIANSLFLNCKSADHFVDALVNAFKSLAKSNQNYFNLFLEGLVVAKRSSLIRQELTDLYELFRASLINSLNKMQNDGIISTIIPPIGLATLIMGVLDGIGIQLMTVKGMAENDENWSYIKNGLLAMMNKRRWVDIE